MKKIDRSKLTHELFGSAEIDESLLEGIDGGDCHSPPSPPSPPPPPFITTPMMSCVPPGMDCP